MKPFILTVDTEPDDAAWRGLSASHLAFESLQGLRRFGKLVRDFELRATMLVTHSVAVHPAFEPLLEEAGLRDHCEIGTHFHPADTPPFQREGRSGDNLTRISDDVLEEKFVNLHEELSSRFGAPRVFRGGAWALDARVLNLLSRYKYTVDSTVTPGISWLANGRPSYLDAPMRAYRLDAEHPCRPGHSDILEIPVSISAGKGTPAWMTVGKIGSIATMPLYSHRQPLIALWRKLRPSAPIWLRPAFTPLASMHKVVDPLLEAGYLHGMAHSNEFWPGTSPYSGNATECDVFFARLQGMCSLALDKGCRPMTLSEARAVLDPAPGTSG